MEASGDIARRAPTRRDGTGREAALWDALRADASATARVALFDLHAAFAKQIAAKHYLDRKSGDIEFSDLCQYAFTGLLEALDRFDPSRGTPFRAFARRRIAGSILNGLAHLSELREQMAFRQRVRRERLRTLSVSDPETLGAGDAMQALVEMATGLALGFMIEDSGLYVGENEADRALSPYESVAWREMARSLTAEIGKLPRQEQNLIRYHYFDGLSFEQISRVFGLSKGRISQIHRAALAFLTERLSPGVAFNLKK